MSELPSQEALIKLNRSLADRIQRLERWRKTRAMMQNMMGVFSSFNSKIIPDVLAGPSAQTRKSVLTLEESLQNFDSKLKDIDEKYEAMLDQIRQRTALLRAWNEAL